MRWKIKHFVVVVVIIIIIIIIVGGGSCVGGVAVVVDADVAVAVIPFNTFFGLFYQGQK